MKPLLKILIISLMNLASFSLFASHIEVKDTINVNTIWSADTVKITGDLYLAANDSLKIQPGTRVEFQGNFSFISDGIIIAIGAANDSIVLTINDTTGFSDFNSNAGGWKMIQSKLAGYAFFNYCIIEYGKNISGTNPVIDFFRNTSSFVSVSFNNSSVRYCYSKDTTIVYVAQGISRCNIYDNFSNAFQGKEIFHSIVSNNKGNGVIIIPALSYYVDAHYSTLGHVQNCQITNNAGYGIYFYEKASYDNDGYPLIFIKNNQINGNDGGIYLAGIISSTQIEDNIINENKSLGAISFYKASSLIVNNLIYNNTLEPNNANDSLQSSINLQYSGCTFYNNTIVNNQSVKGGGVYSKNSTSNFTNNIFWGNRALNDAYEIKLETSTSRNIKLNTNIIQNGVNAVFAGTNINLLSDGNLTDYPEFTDTLENDFSISKLSPCIDKCKVLPKNCNVPNVYEDYFKKDLKGNVREFNNFADIGAYEYIPDSVFYPKECHPNPGFYPISIIINEFCEKQYKSIYLTGIPSESVGGGDCYEIYQWKKDGNVIENATYKYLHLKNVTKKDAGKYSAKSPTSAFYYEYIISVSDEPLGQMENKELTVSANSDTNISLKNLSQNKLTFKWFKDGTILSDTSESLTLHNILLSDSGNYYCVIEDDCHTTYTDSVKVTVIPYCQAHPAKDTLLFVSACGSFSFNGEDLTTTGIYSDTISNYCGCDSLITLHLTIPEINTDVEITDEGLDATQVNADYQWINCNENNLPIAGAESQSYIPEKTGNYAVIIGSEGCADTSGCQQFTKTGVNPMVLENEILVYPNPFSGSTTIMLENENRIIDEIRLININGATILNVKNINNNRFILNKTDLKAGTYMLLIIADSRIYLKELVIE